MKNVAKFWRASWRRVVLVLPVALALPVALMGSAAADSPDSSGVVVRPDESLVSAFPDPENGFAVYVNITREDLCDSGVPAEDVDFQFVNTPSSAQLLLIKGSDLPAYLHRFDGDVPTNPCVETIDEQPAFVGTVDMVYNDNETCPCQNDRTNSFGQKGRGIFESTADGSTWHYAWDWRLLIDKNDEFSVAAESYLFHPIGG